MHPVKLDSVKLHPVKLLERATGTAVHIVRHPIASVAYAAGLARGLAGAAVHGVTVTGHDPEAGQVPTPRADTGVPEPQRVPKPVPDPADLPEPIVIEPEPAGEAFATEPKATSRDSEHGRSGGDEQIDEWQEMAAAAAIAEEAGDVDIETPVGTTGADVGHNPDTAEADLQQPGTEPLFDPGTAKSVRKEAAMMQRAADPDKE